MDLFCYEILLFYPSYLTVIAYKKKLKYFVQIFCDQNKDSVIAKWLFPDEYLYRCGQISSYVLTHISFEVAKKLPPTNVSLQLNRHERRKMKAVFIQDVILIKTIYPFYNFPFFLVRYCFYLIFLLFILGFFSLQLLSYTPHTTVQIRLLFRKDKSIQEMLQIHLNKI